MTRAWAVSITVIAAFGLHGCASVQGGSGHDRVPAGLSGAFEDDYSQRYVINDTLWQQGGAARYHVVRWDAAGRFAIARNDSRNPGDGGMWTRIDWVQLPLQVPFTWGYCYTVYRAKSAAEASAAPPADGANPRTGCNGFPFTRMRQIR